MRIITSAMIWIDFTLLFTLLSYQWRASPLTIGTATALYGLSGLILGPWFGALADRSDPLKLLRTSYLTRAFASLGLITSPNLAIFIFFVAAQGTANLGVMPSEQILVKRALPPDWMLRHARYTGMFDQISKVAAPLVGAALAHRFGARMGYALSALLVVPATACLHVLRNSVRARRAEGDWRQGASRSLGVLLAVLRQRTDYRLAYVATLLQTVVLGLYDPLLALFLRQLGMPIGTFGVIVAATACGGVAAAAAIRRVPAIQGASGTEWLLAGFGMTVFLPGLLVSVGHAPPMDALILLWLINGYCYGATALRFVVVQQALCPPECLGRAAATARSSQLAALVCGPLAGSMLATLAGIPAILMMAGGGAIAFALGLRAYRMRR